MLHLTSRIGHCSELKHENSQSLSWDLALVQLFRSARKRCANTCQSTSMDDMAAHLMQDPPVFNQVVLQVHAEQLHIAPPPIEHQSPHLSFEAGCTFQVVSHAAGCMSCMQFHTSLQCRHMHLKCTRPQASTCTALCKHQLRIYIHMFAELAA